MTNPSAAKVQTHPCERGFADLADPAGILDSLCFEEHQLHGESIKLRRLTEASGEVVELALQLLTVRLGTNISQKSCLLLVERLGLSENEADHKG